MTIAHDVIKRIRAAGERQGWLSCGVKVLAAVSGGGDSMAMLTALRELSVDVAAAHLEHGFRGDDSRADADFVARYCESIGVECHVRSVDVMGTRQVGESAEMAGRRARYEFFDDLAERYGYDLIATGHTSDDSVETIIYNFFRGTGIKGLCGIAGRRGRVVRPLIDCARSELRDYLRDRGVPWREDATNETGRYRRNIIRGELIPWVRANLNSSFERGLLGLADECASLSRDVDARARESIATLAADAPDFALAAWDARRASAMTRTELLAAIRAQGDALGLPVLDRARAEEMARLVERGGRWRFQWASDVEAVSMKGAIYWVHRPDIDRLAAFTSEFETKLNKTVRK